MNRAYNANTCPTCRREYEDIIPLEHIADDAGCTLPKCESIISVPCRACEILKSQNQALRSKNRSLTADAHSLQQEISQQKQFRSIFKNTMSRHLARLQGVKDVHPMNHKDFAEKYAHLEDKEHEPSIVCALGKEIERERTRRQETRENYLKLKTMC